MRIALICLLILLSPARSSAAEAAKQTRLDLDIVKEGWGKAGLKDVEAVLRSAARELLVQVPDAKLEPIRVYPTGGPISLYERSKDGRIIVKLDTGDLYWSQYAFQFGHELCHVLCHFRQGDRTNLWFEEAICELSSLYVLRQMSQTWKTTPPYPNWKSYAENFANYAQDRIRTHVLPADTTLSQWIKDHSDSLAKNPEDREQNTVVAAALLPLFEKEPGHWAAMQYLNTDRPDGKETLVEYLTRWHNKTPEAHQAFVRKIAAELGVELHAG